MGLTGTSDYLQPTFRTVIEHIHDIVLTRGRRHNHANKALGILFDLVKKTSIPLVDGAWITGLLNSAAGGAMDDETFILFMRLSARRKEEAAPDMKTSSSQEPVHATGGVTGSISHGGNVSSETPIAGDTLFNKIMDNVQNFIKEASWHDEAMYGGLVAIGDIPGLGTCLPTVKSIEALSKAMEKGDKPLRVRKAAYDVVLVSRHGWLKSADLREALENLDIPRKLHSVVIETGRSDHQCLRLFLEMIEILAEDRFWHPYLRKAMDIWLPFRHEGPGHVLRILTTVGEMLVPECEGSKHPLDRSLEKHVEEEWERVPGRFMKDLTADRLRPLAEITKQLKELLLTESDRKMVLGAVERVIPSLEKRREDGYDGPGEDIRNIINGLLEVLQSPVRPAKRRSTYW